MGRRLLPPFVRKLGLVLLSVSVGLGLLFSAMHWCWVNQPAIGAELDRHDRFISVPNGTARSKVYKLAEESGMVASGTLFRILDSFFGGSKPFLAGEYSTDSVVSMKQVAELLRSSNVVRHDLVIPEGWTVKQIVRKLESIEILTGKISQLPEEGTLFPAVYQYAKGDDRNKLLKWMTRRMDQELRRLWPLKHDGVKIKTEKEWVILASLVERETGRNNERSLIASVFFNRLRLGYRLQTDPTVIYQQSDGLGVLGRKLRISDLNIDGPYNTYRRYGLPVGPIANPGRDSLLAVLQPAITNYLYFVADGEGGHRFAENLVSHNKNVQLFRQR